MLTLLAVNVGIFAYELSLGGDQQLNQLFYSAGVIPTEFTTGVDLPPPPPLGMTWTTLITSMFLHGGFLHIGGNMLYLFIFGDNVEDRLGHVRFLIFYFICGIAAGLTHIFFNAASTVPSVGASGAIAGVLAAYLRLFPSAQVRTLLILGPFITLTRLPAGILILFWFVIQFVSSLLALGATSDQSGGVATWAHVGGFVTGFVLAQFITPRRQPALSSS
jgi:membrane associated rhomboid family serine protease